MGCFRLILAFSVLAGHGAFYQPFFLINALAAVFCFFVISGFYMAMVIEEKYRQLPNWQVRFLTNRVIRLYPAYFAALAFAIAVQIQFTGSNTIVSYSAPQPWEIIVPLLNFTLVGQDLFMIARDNGILAVDNAIMIQPAWSVAVELSLYVIAAFAFRSGSGILLTLATATMCHFFFFKLGLGSSRFVLNVLIYFSMGATGYLIYRLIRNWPLRWRAGLAAIVLGAMLILIIRHGGFLVRTWPTGYEPTEVFYVLTAIGVPFFFSLTRESAVDRFLGDLSYPLYLTHITLFDTAYHLGLDGESKKIFMAVASIGISALIVIVIEWPIETLRRRISLSIDRPDKLNNTQKVIHYHRWLQDRMRTATAGILDRYASRIGRSGR